MVLLPGGDEAHCHLGGSPDSYEDCVSRSWMGSARRHLLRIHGGATRSCIGRWTHSAWPMVGIPIITPRGLQGSAQHHLHAAEGLKPEFPRAGTTVHPSLLDFGKGVVGQVGSCGLGMGLCIFHLCWSFDAAGDEQGGLPHSRALPPLRAENVVRVAAVETTKCSHKIRSLSGSDKLKQQYHRRAEMC